MKGFCKLSLYVTAPEHPVTAESIQTLKEFLAETLAEHFELEVVDILESPEEALKEGIIATPTLVRGVPPPSLRMIGDFTNRNKVLAALGIEG